MIRALLITLLALALYTLTAGGHLYSPDEEVMFRMARSLFEERDLSIEPYAGGFASKTGTDGQQYAQYGVGQPLLALPFYALGKWLAPGSDDAGWKSIYGIDSDEPDGSRGFAPTAAEIAPRFAVSFFNILLSALMAGLVYLLLLELAENSAASTLAALLYAFGSMAWAHSRPFFTELGSGFFIALSWYCVMRASRGRMPAWALAAGLAAGYAALVRIDSVLFYPGLGVALVVKSLELNPRPKSALMCGLFCLPAAACGAVILWLNWAHFGDPFMFAYSDQPEGVNLATPLLHGLYGFLFSAGKGLFFFSPPLILGLWGWGAMAKGDKRLTAAVALSILVPLVFHATWQNWPGGWCWGPRHIFAIHAFLAVPVAAWLADNFSAPRRIAACVLLLVGAGVQLLGCSQDFIQFHYLFYRDPRHGFRVFYDPADEAYWNQRGLVKVEARPSPDAPWQPASIRSIPGSVQESIYIPQASVWSGYPTMLREYGMNDNLWLRLAKRS